MAPDGLISQGRGGTGAGPEGISVPEIGLDISFLASFLHCTRNIFLYITEDKLGLQSVLKLTQEAAHTVTLKV